MLSQYVTAFEIRANLAELMALADAFKLSIDVQLGAIELVTPVPAKTQILKFYQPHMGKQKPKTSIIAQTSAKVVDSLYARICLRTCNLLDSYYLKMIFSEPSLDIRTSSFDCNYYLRKSLSNDAMMNIVLALPPSCAKEFRAIPE